MKIRFSKSKKQKNRVLIAQFKQPKTKKLVKIEITCFVFKYWRDIKIKLYFTKGNNKTNKLKGNRRKLNGNDIK